MVSIFYTKSVTQLNEGLMWGKKNLLLNENWCFYVNTVIFTSVHIHSSMRARVGFNIIMCNVRAYLTLGI